MFKGSDENLLVEGSLWRHRSSCNQSANPSTIITIYVIKHVTAGFVHFTEGDESYPYKYSLKDFFFEFKPEIDVATLTHRHVTSIVGWLKNDPVAVSKIYDLLIELDI